MSKNIKELKDRLAFYRKNIVSIDKIHGEIGALRSRIKIQNELIKEMHKANENLALDLAVANEIIDAEDGRIAHG